MRVIRTGEERTVFVFKNVVVKIPKFNGYSKFYGLWISILRGWQANRTEYIWSNFRDKPCLGLVKHSYLLSFIIVMKRYDMISKEEFDNVEFNFNHGGYEHKMDSIGKDEDGKYIIVDFG